MNNQQIYAELTALKRDLGLLLLGMVFLLLLQGVLVYSLWLQLAILASYGILGAAWIIVRAHRLLQRVRLAADAKVDAVGVDKE